MEVDGGAEDAAPVETSLSITAPMMGESFVRSSVSPDAELMAPIAFSAAATGEIVKVEWKSDDGLVLGAVDAPFSLTYNFLGDGPRWVEAIGRAGDGSEKARARVDFKVTKGTLTCRQILDGVGQKYTVGPMNKGVKDPITVTLPIRGLNFFAYGGTKAQTALFMDCSLAVALHKLAGALQPKGIVALEHIGIYNYRCIGGGNPDTDNCTPSMHAQARGIDIHELRDMAGTTYNVETDWIIDPDAEKTCSAKTANVKDALLHEVACNWNALAIFNIILTPNYNADHRNHFHVDLTDGSDFINAASAGVDPAFGLHGD
jgi:hypothetical protein